MGNDPIEISVTEEDIRLGVRCDNQQCPVALAIQRVEHPGEMAVWPVTSAVLLQFIQDFDSGHPVEPFTFPAFPVGFDNKTTPFPLGLGGSMNIGKIEQLTQGQCGGYILQPPARYALRVIEEIVTDFEQRLAALEAVVKALQARKRRSTRGGSR